MFTNNLQSSGSIPTLFPVVAKTSVLLEVTGCSFFLRVRNLNYGRKRLFFEKKWVRSELRNDDGAAGNSDGVHIQIC